jgi:2-dehydropantoate 2-reductase
MRVAVIGPGAIGGFLGARLAQSGADVIALARSATAEALRVHGWRVVHNGARTATPAEVYTDPRKAGTVDVAILTLKGPGLAAVAPTLAPMLHADTVIVSAMNGVPWWFGAALPALAASPVLQSVDPGGAISAALPFARVLGSVVHMAASTLEPGLVHHAMGQRFIIGEPCGASSARLQAVAAVLKAANLDVEVSSGIQRDIWYKLWGNMTMNPVSALTGATMDRILDDPLVNAFCLSVMGEAAAIGAAIGCPIEQSGEERNSITRKLGAVKTSMLQDVEARRPVEIDAILSAAREIGRRVGVSTPNLDLLTGLARLQARTLGLYPPASAP